MSKLEIILVEPLYPGNVGAIARSAANYGVETIRIVNPSIDYLSLEAKKMALYGYPLLERAEVHASLAEATADCRLVIGTVHQARYHRASPRPLWTVMASCVDVLRQERAALVFGREDNGLTREEVDVCHHLATIPTPGGMSFNLAHSVTVFLYEVHRTLASSIPRAAPKPPTQAEFESFFQLLETALHTLEFIKGSQKDSVMTLFRDVAYRANLAASDLPLLKAVLYKIINR